MWQVGKGKYLSEKAHVNQLRIPAERLKITLGKKTTGNNRLRWEEGRPGALKAFLVICVMCYSGNSVNSALSRLCCLPRGSGQERILLCYSQGRGGSIDLLLL